MFGIIEKEQKLKVEGTLLGKIGTLIDEKGTKTLCKEHYWIRRNIYGQKGNNSTFQDFLIFVKKRTFSDIFLFIYILGIF